MVPPILPIVRREKAVDSQRAARASSPLPRARHSRKEIRATPRTFVGLKPVGSPSRMASGNKSRNAAPSNNPAPSAMSRASDLRKRMARRPPARVESTGMMSSRIGTGRLMLEVKTTLLESVGENNNMLMRADRDWIQARALAAGFDLVEIAAVPAESSPEADTNDRR